MNTFCKKPRLLFGADSLIFSIVFNLSVSNNLTHKSDLYVCCKYYAT